MRLCKHEYDISRSLCPRCSIEAKEAGIERRIAEASKTGQAMGAAAESERFHAAWGMANGRSDYDKDAWKMVQAAMEKVPFDRLASLARTVEPRDTEPPRRDAVVGKPSTWEEAEAGEEEPEDIWTDEEHWRAMSQEGRSEILYQVRKEGTPAPEPSPDVERLTALAGRIRQEHGLANVREDIAKRPLGPIGWTLNQLNNRCVTAYDKLGEAQARIAELEEGTPGSTEP